LDELTGGYDPLVACFDGEQSNDVMDGRKDRRVGQYALSATYILICI
jgi:hypothetical protein